MIYQVLNERGEAMDARLEIDGSDIVFHSRGGTRGTTSARNLDYGTALRLLLHRIEDNGITLEAVWIDSDEVQKLPRSERRIFERGDATDGADEQFRAISRNMQAYGRPPNAPYGGSRVKKIRIRLASAGHARDLQEVLRLTESAISTRAPAGVPVALFDAITPEHVWEAVQLLDAGEPHSFGQADDFELISGDGMRHHPKAVFDVAARLALGRTLDHEHFTVGFTNHCHRALQSAGFEIVKHGASSRSNAMPLAAEDREWSEGQPKLVLHLKRERAAGLARAKKAAFIRVHGRLFCEKCGLDPVALFGSELGEACIEVHHDRTAIARMGEGARTTLDDLRCLCANCHRILHAAMRRAIGVKPLPKRRDGPSRNDRTS
jgi:Predicted restriction endonuclease